ncbi:MAG: hypothetical protein AABW65_02255 [Nanoarchaeota archaeon]
MKTETHEEAFETHKRAIFSWGLGIEGIDKSQRIVGLHAARGILELLSLYLHRKKIVRAGFQLNHRWFKSKKVFNKLPDFENKNEIVTKLIELENLCEVLTYGKKISVETTQKAIKLFTELEEILRKMP